MGGGFGRPFFDAMVQSRKFPGVTITSTPQCCDAVREFHGKRILASQAPKLPLSACSMPDRCRCRFQKHADRRDDDEGRRFRFGQERGAWYAGNQRRKTRGRRNAD